VGLPVHCPNLRQTGMKVKYVTTQERSFDVSFLEKLLETAAATRGESFFILKFAKYRLAAGLQTRRVPGAIKRSPRPSSRNKGAYF